MSKVLDAKSISAREFGEHISLEGSGKRDIDDRARGEKLLRKERDRAQMCLDIAGSIIVLIDADRKVGLINRKGCEVLGRQEDEIIGKDWFECFLPDHDRRRVEETFHMLMAGEIADIEYFENAVVTPEGGERLIAWHNSYIRNDRGDIVATLSSGEDITERRRAEQALEWESKVNATLAELASTLTGTVRSIDEISLIVLDQARQVTESEHGYVSSIDPETGDNVCHTLTRMMESCPVKVEDKTITFPKGEDGLYRGLWGFALNTQQSFYTNSAASHPSCRGTPEGHIKIYSFLTVPVMIGGELLGQIALANPRMPYGDRDLEAIERIGELYALALQRHYAREDLLRHQQRLENIVEERTRHLEAEVADRKQAEEALQDLSGRLISAQEEERSRIALELHDDISQRLALLAVELEQLGQKPPATKREIRDKTLELCNCAREISSDLHSLSHRLHPSHLRHVGLFTAVKRLCESLSAQKGLKISFKHRDLPKDIPESVALCLYRIAQEALQNVVKHSGARKVLVELSGVTDSLCLRIKDAGIGFDPESFHNKSGLGFVSMRERLRLVGGKLSVQSQPLSGTQIEVRIPL